MRGTFNRVAAILAAGATATAILVAPIASASTTSGASGGSAPVQQSCASLGGTQTQCVSPGNAQINDAPPQVDYFPYAGGGT
jgi:hypothetical protein